MLQDKNEESITNTISNSCWKYFSLGGGLIPAILFVTNCIIAQIFQHGSSYWLSIWTNSEMIRYTNESAIERNLNVSTNTGIGIYSGIVGGAFIFCVLSTAQFYIMCTISSTKLHKQMFNAVLRSPMSFFDKNPVGKSSQ